MTSFLLCGRDATSASILLVFPARVLTQLVQPSPNVHGAWIAVCTAHGVMPEGAGREKTFRCRRSSRRAVRSARDSGGSSNQRASLCATLQSAPDHCSQLDRLL